MNKTVWLVTACVLGAVAINACGSGTSSSAATEGGSDTGTGGNATTSTSGTGGSTTSTTSSSSSSGSTTTSTSSSSTSSGSTTVNGCDPATAEDHKADATTTVTFPTGGLKYSPPCIKIAKGNAVKFDGSFASHPLSGGQDGTMDATSPITHTTTGTTATFTFPNAGTFPYFCDFHFSSGMEGAIFVE